MAALSEAPIYEQHQAEESPALRKFREAMGASRFSRLMAVYVLQDELDSHLCDDPEEIIRRFAKAAGTSPEALKADLRWARSIREEDLRGAFAEEDIPDLEWSERITLEHLRTIAKATRPDGRLLTSEEMARWLVSSYHGDETAAEFKDHLRGAGLLRPKPAKHRTPEDDARDEETILWAREAIGKLVGLMAGDRGPEVQKRVIVSWQRRTKALGGALEQPGTVWDLLKAVASIEQAAGRDIPLKVTPDQWTEPREIADLLELAARRYRQVYPKAAFTLGAELKRNEEG